MNLKCLDTIRNIIMRNVQKGLLPNYSLDIMHMDNQYNTIGVIGIYEVLSKYGLVEVDEFGNHSYTDEALKFSKEI
ncbi:MAG: anaerobic ribonucleoside-triphosphate reductase, partial [Alphaproteobacteria bacterium]|nr:anaerobic ribonucleoside-triphosphate reductase [Alphaproteobacteria bacterium]